MKPKLYQYAACPFCSKVKSMLAYKGAAYETIEVNPMKKKEIDFSPDYRRVPIYIDAQGKQVNDSNVIMKHIDGEFPEKPVFAKDAGGSARDEKWLAWSEKLVKGLPTVVYNNLLDSIQAFDYITKTGKFGWLESRAIKYSGAFVMTLVAKKIRKREAIDNPREFLKKMTEEWTEGLEGRPFMGGEAPGAADIAVFGIARVVGELKAGEVFKENPEFSAWIERMKDVTGITLAIV